MATEVATRLRLTNGEIATSRACVDNPLWKWAKEASDFWGPWILIEVQHMIWLNGCFILKPHASQGPGTEAKLRRRHSLFHPPTRSHFTHEPRPFRIIPLSVSINGGQERIRTRTVITTYFHSTTGPRTERVYFLHFRSIQQMMHTFLIIGYPPR